MAALLAFRKVVGGQSALWAKIIFLRKQYRKVFISPSFLLFFVYSLNFWSPIEVLLFYFVKTKPQVNVLFAYVVYFTYTYIQKLIDLLVSCTSKSLRYASVKLDRFGVSWPPTSGKLTPIHVASVSNLPHATFMHSSFARALDKSGSATVAMFIFMSLEWVGGRCCHWGMSCVSDFISLNC